jgi:nucleoside-diphosphate-sugar epimerase
MLLYLALQLGVSAVAHLVTVTGFSADPEQVISPVVSMITNLLRSASKIRSIKRFVYTSSTAAGISHSMNGTPSSVHLDETTWNAEASRLARELPSDDPTKGYQVYCASKTEAERAAWQFMEAEQVSESAPSSFAPVADRFPVLHSHILSSTPFCPPW